MSLVLAVMLDLIRDQSKLSKRWCDAREYETNHQPDAGRLYMVDSVMEKTGALCELSIYGGSVSIDFTLPHMEEIPSMNSKFWQRLANVVESQDVKFKRIRWDTIGESKAKKTIANFTKSPVFSFLTHFHLAYQHRHSVEHSEFDGYSGPYWASGLGTFEKSIFYQESSWSDIIFCFSGLLVEFTKLSQELYRSHYIKTS